MKKNTYITFGIILIIIAFIVFGLVQCSAGQRFLKTAYSDVSGGLERTVDVYDYSGNMIATYEGKIDIEYSDYGNKVLFDMNGKRVVIYNAIVIVNEK